MNTNLVKTLSYAGLLAALTFISTSVIAIPNAFTGGFIHLGDALVLSCGVILGKKYGALSAGIGSAMADLYLGYTQWALPTFIIKALMAFIVGYIFEQPNNKKRVVTLSTTLLGAWLAFTLVLFSLLRNGSLMSLNLEGIIGDAFISQANELPALLSFTQNVVLIAGLLLPLLVLAIYQIIKRSKANLFKGSQFMALISAGTVMMSLYYATYGILYGNWIVPMFSVPANLVQYGFGVVIASLLLPLSTIARKNLLMSR